MANNKKPGSGNRTEPVKKKTKKVTEPSASNARIDRMDLLRRAAIAALALVLIFGIVLSANSLRGELLQRKVTFSYSGVLQRECIFPIEFSDEQLTESVRATKRHGQTHAFSYFCNGTLRLSEINMTGFILFGNPADNDCTLILTITDKDGKIIYRSGGVEPGKYITQIRPFVEWENGEYACTAYVLAYAANEQGYKCIGVQYSRLQVKVGETS